MTLQRRLLSALIPLVLVPLILAGWLMHRHTQTLAREQAAQQLQWLADQTQAHLDTAQKQARQPLLEASPLTAAGQADILARHPDIVQLETLDAQGQRLYLWSALPTALPPPTTSTGPEWLPSLPGQTVPLLRWVETAPANALGVSRMALTLPVSGLAPLFAQARQHLHTRLYLRGNQGPLSHRDDLLNRLDADTDRVQIGQQPWLIQHQTLGSGLTLTAFTASTREADRLEQLNRNLSYIGALSGLVAVILLHSLITRRITRPLQHIRKTADRIARGELDGTRPLPASADSADEVSALTTAFSTLHRHLLDASHQIEELSSVDTLTGLANKSGALESIQHHIHRAQQKSHSLAVLFFDLDNFKHINDGLGHQLGDILLMQVSNRLKDCLRNDDSTAQNPAGSGAPLLARMGGDEFTLVLPELYGPQQAARMAERILAGLATAFQLQDRSVFVSASIGIALYPQHGDSAEALLRHADIAMYAAKSRGKNTFQCYDASLHKPASERLALEASMRAALENGEFILFYQPRVPVQGQTRIEFEALIRWKHPEKGMISPALFIPLAEETGYIQALGDWVLEEACRQLHTWNRQGLPPVCVSVNLSPVQLNFGNPLGCVQRCLRQFDLQPAQLELEITESGLMQNETHAIDVLCKLKETGVRIALDDFGTGYSSLAYLRRFPIDTLKIDRSFIRDLEQDPESILVLESIIGLAQNLKLEIVAEGIETARQRDMLIQRGCDFIQGFLFAKPLPAEEAMHFFENHTREQQEALMARKRAV